MFAAIVLAFFLVAAVATAARHGHDRRAGGMPAPGISRSSSEEPAFVSRKQARPTDYWHRRFLAMRHLAYVRGVRVRQLKRGLLATPTVTEAIGLAAVAYGQSAAFMRQIALCESTLQADPPHNNVNRGLFQFNPGTFAGTPYGRFSILSPYANALAAGWMLQHGRRNEWAC